MDVGYVTLIKRTNYTVLNSTETDIVFSVHICTKILGVRLKRRKSFFGVSRSAFLPVHKAFINIHRLNETYFIRNFEKYAEPTRTCTNSKRAFAVFVAGIVLSTNHGYGNHVSVTTVCFFFINSESKLRFLNACRRREKNTNGKALPNTINVSFDVTVALLSDNNKRTDGRHGTVMPETSMSNMLHSDLLRTR